MDETIIPLPVGSEAPDFELLDVLSGETVRLSGLRGAIVVLNFWSGECAWSRLYDEYFSQRAPRWAQQDIWLLHISSNANEDANDIAEAAAELGVAGPILHDVGHTVADAYGAQTTPHIFVIAPDGRIAYQGAVDDRRFGQQEATINYLDNAIGALLLGVDPDPAETPAYGCAIVREYG